MKHESIERIMKYCAEAERSTQEVISKLVSWGIPIHETSVILTKLRNEGFLDEVRYAKTYVRDKWNLNRWGRVKIEYGLHQKNVSYHVIQKALEEISEQEYLRSLHEMLREKLREVKSVSKEDDVSRVLMFAMSRGFEEDLIHDWISSQKLLD